MNRIDSLFLSLLLAWTVWVVQGGGGGSVFVPVDLPIDEPGKHCLFVRSHDDTLTKGEAAVIGSQEIENLFGEGYYVHWTDEEAPEKYAEAISKMAGEFPQWCVVDSEQKDSEIGPVPQSLDEAKQVIAKVTGG